MKGLTLALASLAILIGGPAQAATLVCTTYASVAKQLAARHQETVVARGLAADGGHLIEVFASPARGTSSWSCPTRRRRHVCCRRA